VAAWARLELAVLEKVEAAQSRIDTGEPDLEDDQRKESEAGCLKQAAVHNCRMLTAELPLWLNVRRVGRLVAAAAVAAAAVAIDFWDRISPSTRDWAVRSQRSHLTKVDRMGSQNKKAENAIEEGPAGLAEDEVEGDYAADTEFSAAQPTEESPRDVEPWQTEAMNGFRHSPPAGRPPFVR
jgi:ABC-type transport system involved in cytochrome bd biosynthesis fused ATPase/permease subunit